MRARPQGLSDLPPAARTLQGLLDGRHPDYWYPAKAKIIVNANVDNGKKYISFVVDPGYPNRWREDPYFSDIKKIAQAGIDGRLGEHWLTLVMVGAVV